MDRNVVVINIFDRFYFFFKKKIRQMLIISSVFCDLFVFVVDFLPGLFVGQ